MKKFFALTFALIAISTTAWGIGPDKVATITADNVNMRKSPSASSKPLGWISTGSYEEEGCYIPDMMWKPDVVRKGKFVNTQLNSGEVYPVIAQDGEWIQLEYKQYDNEFKPWIMAKFARIETPGNLYPGITFNEDNDWVNTSLTILPDGRTLYYEESDPVNDGGIYFGTLKDGKVIIDRFVDGAFYDDPDIKGISVKNEGNGLSIYWGKDLSNPSHDNYLSLYLSRLTEEMYDNISKFGKKIDNPFIIYLTPAGWISKVL